MVRFRTIDGAENDECGMTRANNNRHVFRTEEEKYEAIEQALQKLDRQGLIVDTGRRRWSKRTRSYQIVWAKAPGAEF